jgi:hypothetical protein
MVAKVTERVQAHYEIQVVPMGKVYIWCPETIVIECECEEKLTLSGSKKAYCKAYCTECGADHQAIVQEALGAHYEEDEDDEEIVSHPWRSPHPYYTPTRGT